MCVVSADIFMKDFNIHIHTPGFRKYRADMNMSNNYLLLFLSSCWIVCGETTTYSTAMCDISLGRAFNCICYGISQVQIGLSEHQRRTFAQPHPLTLDRLGGSLPPYKRSKKMLPKVAVWVTKLNMFIDPLGAFINQKTLHFSQFLRFYERQLK